jgi:hypothetical protein
MCPRQLCASHCRLGPGGPCNTHVVKPKKSKTRATVSHSSGESRSIQDAGHVQVHCASLSSEDEDLAIAIEASLQTSTSRKSGFQPVVRSSQLPALPSVPKLLTLKPRISSQMPPAWQTKLKASSKALVEKEERAARQALLQQALKENLNILFFDKVSSPPFPVSIPLRHFYQDGERGRQLALQGSKDMPDFPWVKPEEFIHRCGSDIIAIDHRTTIGRWVELGRLDIVYKVSNNETLVFRRRGVCDMPGIDEGIDGTHPPPPPHFFKAISSQRTAVRQEKKARERPQEVTREASPFLPMAPRPLSLLSYHSTPEKKARERPQEVMREASPFLPMAPRPLSSLSYHSTPAAGSDCGSSDIEVSEVMDHRDLMQSAHGSSSSSVVKVHKNMNNTLAKQGHNSPSPIHTHSYNRSSSSNFSRSTSPVTIHSSPPLMSSRSLYAMDRDTPSSPSLSFPESSASTFPEQSDNDAYSSPPSSLPSLPPPSPSGCLSKSRPKKDLPWHHGLYCVDVIDGFEQMGSQSLKGLSKAERFKIAFPLRRFAATPIVRFAMLRTSGHWPVTLPRRLPLLMGIQLRACGAFSLRSTQSRRGDERFTHNGRGKGEGK